MPELTKDQKVTTIKAIAAKALAGHPKLAEIQATNFDRCSDADITDFARRLGGLVS